MTFPRFAIIPTDLYNWFVMKSILVSVIVIMAFESSYGSNGIPYTLEDRDRLIRIEAQIKSIEKTLELIDKRFEQIDKRFEQIDKRFEQVDKRFEQVDKRFEQIERRFELIEKRFDQIISLLIGIVAAFAAIVAVTVGFAVWDRRTAVAPVLRKSEELREKSELIESVLKEYSKSEPKLAEIMKKLGLL